jgi:predicted Fe-Mo cluster-binding NifX family protein
MIRKFVFAREVEELVAAGGTKMELPEGTRFSPAAADLVKEKGIKVIFTAAKGEKRERDQDIGSSKGEKEAPESASAEGLIAVASSGKSCSGEVGSTAARSPFFLIFNREGALVEVLENPFSDSSGGAGPLVAGLMAEKGISLLVAGNFGKNIRAVLNEKGIRHIEFQGQAGGAVKEMMRKNV